VSIHVRETAGAMSLNHDNTNVLKTNLIDDYLSLRFKVPSIAPETRMPLQTLKDNRVQVALASAKQRHVSCRFSALSTFPMCGQRTEKARRQTSFVGYDART
jgi:hypothetical protein